MRQNQNNPKIEALIKDFMDKKISVLVSNAHKALSKDPGMFFNYL